MQSLDTMTQADFEALKKKVEDQTATSEEQLQYLEILEVGIDAATELVESINPDQASAV
jgi:hypothetical protein